MRRAATAFGITSSAFATVALVAHPTVLTTVGALLVWLAASVIVCTAYVRRSQ